MNITFPDNRANAKLGPPSRSRGGQKTPEELKVLGDKILKRDKWTFPSFGLQIPYLDSGEITMITLNRNSTD